MSLRPVEALPLRLHAEARGTQIASRRTIRPALFAVSELPVVDLPAGFAAETYVQAGWIGGKNATGFVDAQARIDRPLARAGPAEVRAGGGAWAGAQEGVGRVDIGPSLTLDMRGSGAPVRLSVDYRLQVVGNARPGDGLAVTLSTGF